jgi:hypothetical protein
MFGYAAEKMSNTLRRKGARILSMTGFFVASSGNGLNLKDGELDRAATWLKEALSGEENL